MPHEHAAPIDNHPIDSRRHGPPETPPPQGEGFDPQIIVSVAARIVCHSHHGVHCGLTMVSAGRAPETIAATDDLPVRVDWLQHELGQGPGINPPLGEVVVSRNMASDNRWPDFGKMCAAVMDVRSMVSIRIPHRGPGPVIMNWYSSEPAALDRLDVDAALRLALLAAPAVNSLVDQFGGALAACSRKGSSRVAVAVGTVVARYRVDETAAFNLLLQASHFLHRPLLDVALQVAADGWLPESSTAWSHRTGDLPESRPEGDPPPVPWANLHPIIARRPDRRAGGPTPP